MLGAGIRHPEELSLLRKWDKDDLKRVAKEVTKYKRKRDAGDAPPGPLSPNGTLHSSSGSIDGKLSPYPSRSPLGPSPTVSTTTRCMQRRWKVGVGLVGLGWPFTLVLLSACLSVRPFVIDVIVDDLLGWTNPSG